MGFISTGHGCRSQKTRRRRFPILRVSLKSRKPLLPGLLSPSPTPPLPEHEYIYPHIHSLDQLPTDVLLLIYCYSGVGEANNLAFVNKHLHLLVPLVHNSWWLQTMVKHNFTADLNTNVSQKWERKYAQKYMKLPQELRDLWSGSEFLLLPEQLEATRNCLRSQLFHYTFIDGGKVKEILAKFGSFALDDDAIAQEQSLRNRFLQYKYAVLGTIVQKALEYTGEAPLEMEEVHSKAENSDEMKALRQKLEIENYKPRTRSDSVPSAVIENPTPKRIETALELSNSFGMSITEVPRLVSAVVSSVEPDVAQNHLAQLASHLPHNYTYQEVTTLLQTLVTCREHILQLPMDERSTSVFAVLAEQVYAMVEDALTKFYKEERTEDRMVWELLAEIEVPALLELVVDLGGTPHSAPQHKNRRSQRGGN